MISNKDERGVLVAGLLILIVAFTGIGTALLSYSTAEYKITVRNGFNASAISTAEAGLEATVRELNLNPDYAGFTTPQVLFNNAEQGRGTFTTTIVDDPTGEAKIITGVSNVYRKDQSSNPQATHTVRVTVVRTGSSGYSVAAGPGGLILSGSANITNSDVYVNGFIQLNGSSSIGTYNDPVNVFVGNNQCPPGNNPGNSYPMVCTNGTQPITFGFSTNIYGSVCATGLTNTGPRPGGNIQAGNPAQGKLGYQSGCTAPAVSPPTYDRAAHIAAMTSTQNPALRPYDCSKNLNPVGFARTFPANIRLNGDADWTSSCDLTLRGNVYITGDLSIGGAANIRVDETDGTDPITEQIVVVVDGEIDVGGSADVIANSQGASIKFISFKSAGSCSPSCTNVTGTDLKISQNLETIDVGGGGSMASASFHADWSKVTLAGSGNVGALAGQTIDMSGSGTVTFGESLGDTVGGTWTVTGYQQL